MSDPTERNEPDIDRVLDHDYDGIQEYDNRLPNWWLQTLWGTVIFGIVYWLAFHTTSAGKLPTERYDLAMAQAAEAQLAAMEGQELNDDALTLMSTVPARVSAGKDVFTQFCVVCHLEQGQGSVGPNLTDDYWIHGGRPMDIHGVVTNGVLEKGMAAWGNQLGPARVMDVTAYVLTLKNTNIPGKEPQGEPESGTGAAAADSTGQGE